MVKWWWSDGEDMVSEVISCFNSLLREAVSKGLNEDGDDHIDRSFDPNLPMLRLFIWIILQSNKPFHSITL